MDPSVQLQFQRLPAEAQRAALWRLALSGLTPEQVAARTGWPVEQIRRAIDEGVAAPGTSWPPRPARHWKSASRSASSAG